MNKTTIKVGIFHKIIEKISKGDEGREMYIWDFFYRYEVYIAVFFAVCCGLITDKINGDFGLFCMASIIGAGIIVFPLYKTSKYDNGFFEKREEIGQFRFLLSTVIGWCAFAMLLWVPVAYLKDNFSIMALVGTILCYPLILLVYIFAKDYSKWRFDWAHDNYDTLWSKHYRWWTSAMDYDVQRTNLKLFRSYKTHATTVLIAGPLCGILLGLCFPQQMKTNSQETNEETIEEVSKMSDSMSNSQNKKKNGEFVGEKEMAGSIGDFYINGTFHFSASGFDGQYGYNGKSTGIHIRGHVNEDGIFSAEEFNYKGEKCGEYHGKFKDNSASGKFTNSKSESFDFIWNFCNQNSQHNQLYHESVDEVEITSDDIIDEEQLSSERCVFVGDECNVRQNPSTNAPIVAVGNDGQLCWLTGKSNGKWYQVRLEDGTVGWTHLINLKKE